VVPRYFRAYPGVLNLFIRADDGAYTIVAAWLAAKLASNWQRVSVEKDRALEQKVITQTLIALMAGTLSVSIGAVAGRFARHYLEYWNWIVPPWC
jgi:hypothetical protein